MVVLESSLTAPERDLVAMGEQLRLREARLFFQYALEGQLPGMSSMRSGVAQWRSSPASTPNVTWIEVFTLQPSNEPDAGRP